MNASILQVELHIRACLSAFLITINFEQLHISLQELRTAQNFGWTEFQIFMTSAFISNLHHAPEND